MIDKVIKLTPLLTILILLSGILNLSIFYSCFQIRITEFISWQEILTLFLSDLFRFVLIFAAYIFWMLSNQPSLLKQENDQSKEAFEFDRSIKAIAGFGYALLFGLLLFISDSANVEVSLFIINVTLVFFMGVLSGLSMLLVNYVERHINFKLDRVIYVCLLPILLMNFYNIPNTFIKAYRLKNYKTERTTSVDLGKKYILPFDDEYYVGKTDNYIIIYNQRKHQSSIYPVSEIKEIKIHTIKD